MSRAAAQRWICELSVNRSIGDTLGGIIHLQANDLPMPTLHSIPILFLLCCVQFEASAQPIPNHLIDANDYAEHVRAALQLRQTRRVSEAEFIRMAREPDTVVLDARSERLFQLLHVNGATNLSFPEFTKASLAAAIPKSTTRVLIYCNNNFEGAPRSMPVKAIASALNLSTFVSLYTYGYRNVYELGPAIDVSKSLFKFAGTEVAFAR